MRPCHVSGGMIEEKKPAYWDAAYDEYYAPVPAHHHLFGYGNSQAFFDVMDHQDLFQFSFEDPEVCGSRAGGIVHFVISPNNLARRNWSAAKHVLWCTCSSAPT